MGCCGTDSLPVAVGVKGDTGAAGAAGADGVAILYHNTSALSSATTASWGNLLTYSLVANTLDADGDMIKISLIAKGGTPAPYFDAIRLSLGGTPAANADASYTVIATPETYHFPFITRREMMIELTLVRVNATTARVYMEMKSSVESRVDIVSTSFSFTFGSNQSLVAEAWNGATSANVTIEDIKIVKYLI